MKGRRKAVDFLITHGANIHACNNDGWNAVTGAYFKKRTDIVGVLLERGAVFGAKYAEAALISAYENGYRDVVIIYYDDLSTSPNITVRRKIKVHKKTKRLFPTAWFSSHPIPLHRITIRLLSRPFAYPHSGQ